MKITFWINKDQLDEVKKKIRSYTTIRFEHNPIIVGDRVNIKISGESGDMSSFNEYLDTIGA